MSIVGLLVLFFSLVNEMCMCDVSSAVVNAVAHAHAVTMGIHYRLHLMRCDLIGSFDDAVFVFNVSSGVELCVCVCVSTCVWCTL